MDILTFIFDRAKITLSLSLHPEQGYTFRTLTKDKPLWISQAVSKLPSTCLPSKYLMLDQTEVQIEIHELLDLRNQLCEMMKESTFKRYHILIDPLIMNLHHIECPENFLIECTWDHHHHKLVVQFLNGVEPHLDGWFQKGNEIWNIPGWTSQDNRWLFNKVEPGLLPYFIDEVMSDMKSRGLPIICPIQFLHEDAIHIAIGDITQETVQLSINWNCQSPMDIPGLDDYVIDGDRLYLGPHLDPLMEFFTIYPIQNGLSLISGDGIPYFIEMLSGEWSHFISGDKERLLETHIIGLEFQLFLLGQTSIINGVGNPSAIPMLSVNGLYVSASDISRQIRPGKRFVSSESGWLPVSLLNQIGIGSMGRATNGSSLEAPIQLLPAEIFNRGSARLEGPWSRFELLGHNWQSGEGNPTLQHLQFLSMWGINGGVLGGLSQWSKPLHDFLQDLTEQYSDSHILIVGKLVQLESLKNLWGESIDILWLTSSAVLNKSAGHNPQWIAMTPSLLSKEAALQKKI
ncbi:hypothetical protein [Paenibacillus agricola]|uniref:Uncharacterized protein n=1 Tax=Paenibacillus agricola TaxID=2716264 RepID=A0ABX0JM52_9BACL|nr:hypothetical protein [Paenibacillus agricola]NHN35456.1 hypothetical protein [Paenibacillus agricola]